MNFFFSNSRIFKDAEKDSRTTRCFSRIKDKTRFDSKFKDSSWRSRTSGNLSCAICAHAHRWDARIFWFYLFADIVNKVSALINCQPSLIIWIVAIFDEYVFLVKLNDCPCFIIFCKSERSTCMYIVLKLVSVFLKSPSGVYELIWKELSL